MKASEKVYTALVVCFALLLVLATAHFQLRFIPAVPEPSWRWGLHFYSAILALISVILGATSAVNLRHKQLGKVPTVMQIVFLFLTLKGIPLGIWGIVLLVKTNRNADQSLDSTSGQPESQ